LTRDRIVDIVTARAGDLVPNPRNWRTHPETQRRGLEQLLDTVGSVDVLKAVRLPDGRLQLVDGHLRAEIRAEEQVRVAVLDLTPEEADLVLATFDPVSAMAGADLDMLRGLLDDVRLEVPSDVLEQLDALVRASDPVEPHADPPEPQVDRASELQVEWQTAVGQVWEIPSKTVSGKCHRVLCGDCRNPDDVTRLLDGQKVNVAFTSPPYASQRKYDEESGFMPIKPEAYVEWFEAVQENVRAHLAQDGSWFVNIKEHCEDGQRHLYVKDLTIAHVRKWGWLFVDEFCWTHGGIPGEVHQHFKNQFESVIHFATRDRFKIRPRQVTHESDSVPQGGGGNIASQQGSGRAGKDYAVGAGLAYPGNVLSLGKAREALGHSAAFPVSLPAFFVKAFSDLGDIIYDPFLGSGTTMIAAEREGRVCVGLELSAKYLAVILQRAKDAGLEPRLVSG